MTSVPVEVYPIIALTGLAVGGATWYISRLARSPDVIWDKKVCYYGVVGLTLRTTRPRGTTWSRVLSTSS